MKSLGNCLTIICLNMIFLGFQIIEPHPPVPGRAPGLATESAGGGCLEVIPEPPPPPPQRGRGLFAAQRNQSKPRSHWRDMRRSKVRSGCSGKNFVFSCCACCKTDIND